MQSYLRIFSNCNISTSTTNLDKINWSTQVTQGTTSLANRFDGYGIGSGYYMDAEGEVFYDAQTDFVELRLGALCYWSGF